MTKHERKLTKALIAVIVVCTLLYLLPYSMSANTSRSFQLLDHTDGSTHYDLNVVVPQSLLEYYNTKSHTLNSEHDFAKFVTPYALQPIANSLKQIYADDEDYTNGVLMIVHQIPYESTVAARYPVETMVNDKGDCDLFSFIAASIVDASGLDAVLLYYENESHMNIAVNLPHAPQDAREEAFFITHNNAKYYVAECTGDKWQTGWRVGECPTDLRNTSPQIITLEGSEQTATGQVSASYASLVTSSLTLSTSASYLLQGSIVALSGQLSPSLPNENITIYIRVNNSPWMILDTVATDSRGQFAYAWSTDASGICYVRASWSGDNSHSADDSSIRSITVLSTFFVVLIVLTAVLVCVGIAAFVIGRQSYTGITEPQPPEIPS
jgi:hypothetical protein